MFRRKDIDLMVKLCKFVFYYLISVEIFKFMIICVICIVCEFFGRVIGVLFLWMVVL